MTRLDTPNKQPKAGVDDILEELKGRAAPRPAGGSVDDVLAELGLGSRKGPITPRPLPGGAAKPSAPAPVAKPAAAPVAEAPPAPPMEQAPRPAAAAPQPPVEKPPAPVREAPSAAGLFDEDGGEDLFARPAAAPAPAGDPEPFFQPDDAPPPRPAKQRGGKFSQGGGSIWDIEPEESEQLPRMGKAAALERVDPEKFSGETELLSWFSEEEDSRAAKKERKRQEKLEKKRLAEEAKEEKRLAKRRGGDEEDYPPEAGPEDFEEPAEGAFTQAPAHQPGPQAGGGSAFDGGDGWDSGEEDFFASAFGSADKPRAFAPQPQQDDDFTPSTPADTAAFAAFAPPADSGTNDFDGGDEDLFAPKPTFKPQPELKDFDTGVFAAAKAASKAAPKAEPADAFFDGGAPGGDMPDDDPFSAPVGDITIQFGAIGAEVELLEGVLPETPGTDDPFDTRSFDLAGGEDPERVPTAAYTQEFDTPEDLPPKTEGAKSLFVDEMVDDRFRDFFKETVIMDREEVEQGLRAGKRKKKKSRSALLTGEFGRLAELAAEDPEAAAALPDEFEDYDRPQDAEAIEGDIVALCGTLTRRTIISGALSLLLLWMGLGFGGLWLPEFLQYAVHPIPFTIVWLVLLGGVIALNFTTVSSGIVGLFSEPTADSAPALASVAALLQGVMLLVQAITAQPAEGTLFGALAGFILCFNALGKRVRAGSILRNFQLASAGYDHSAAYVLDNQSELAYNITTGLEEEDPCLLISRPTALVKGFLRQSFSPRASDRSGRIIGWVLFAFAVAGVAITLVVSPAPTVFGAITAFAAVLCIGAPFSSTLISGVPSLLLQRGASRVGAVVPGWSAIEDLGRVNVVMATARDIFPPSAVNLKGIKTFEKERVDLAILYAASVLIEGCDTLRDIFLAVIQGKSDMLYKVESLTKEPGRGFTAWVENSRVVIGSREMLQRHDIAPPPVELELKHVPAGHMPVYLAVSGKLFAMFIVRYGADPEVQDTLDSLVHSGVSLLVHSDDMNVTEELIETAYDLPHGSVKVLGKRELDILEPLTAYLPESEGVMTHIGTFASFIGGMRAAASCALAERMATIVQIVSVGLITLLCMLLAFSGGLLGLGVWVGLLYQLAWSVVASALPFARKY